MIGNERPLLRLPGPFGAPVEVHPSLLMLAAFILLFSGVTSPAALTHVLIHIGMIVLAILLHEWGHAWGAWVQGVPVRRVVLYGGGGLCYHGRADARGEELIVAAGPLVNLGLWAGCGLASTQLFGMAFGPRGVDGGLVSLAYYLDAFARFNLFLFFLNMIPLQPLDGGRLLLLWLARRRPARQATILAGRVGIVCCAVYPLAMIYALLTFGWIFLFIPSLALHRAMARGETTV